MMKRLLTLLVALVVTASARAADISLRAVATITRRRGQRNSIFLAVGAALLCCVALAWLTGCNSKADAASEAPPPARVIEKEDVNLITVEHPDQFPTTAALSHEATPTLQATGSVTPDISREVPVISLANGRVVAVNAKLGDYVRKGQVLMEVQSTDVSGAYSTYLKTLNDERLAKVQLDRARLLFDKGAIAKSQVEIADDNEQDSVAALTAAKEQLHVLGVDENNPAGTVKIHSPASGVITSQNVTVAAAAGSSLAGSPNAFTIADLSHVWILCDVYENDLPQVQLGDMAEVRLTAYPDRIFKGRVSDIGPVLDPNLRTAKVRIEMENPAHIMRLGMFVTATFHGKSTEKYAAVPATAVLHLHDRDWVYIPAEKGQFRRKEVHTAAMLPNHLQEITSGVDPGQPVVVNALELENAVQQ